MAIDIQSLFNPGSLQDMAETEDERKKRAQLTGTMNLGGQSGTFTGTFDPSLFQQQPGSAPPVGYQLPADYGMKAPPEQQAVPVVPAPAPVPPVGASPISGDYGSLPLPSTPDGSGGVAIQMPPGNQPYQIPPPVSGFDQSIGGDLVQLTPENSGLTPEQFQQMSGFDESMVKLDQPAFITGDDGQRYNMRGELITPPRTQQQYLFNQPADFGPAPGPVAPETPPTSNPLSQIPIGQEYNTMLGPEWQYNADRTQRSLINNQNGIASRMSQMLDPVTGKYGMPGGDGKFNPLLSIGY
jgi:hypothetical protein